MAEQLNLTTPVVPPSITHYRVRRLDLNWDEAYILIVLRGTNGEIKQHMYTGSTATTLMNQANTANHSVTSIHRQVINRLVSDGILAGTVAGTPD